MILQKTHHAKKHNHTSRCISPEAYDTVVRDNLKEIGSIPINTSIADVASQIGTSGYVAESVPLALFGAQQIGRLEFVETLKELISVGGDTDTIAAMAGNVAGALIGFQNLPRKLVEAIPGWNSIKPIVDCLSKQALETGI